METIGTKNLGDGVTLDPGPGGLPCIHVKTPLVQALVSLQGAQVLQFQATGQAPLLWLSPTALFAPGKAIRGGVPLCWPWFGPHRVDPAQGQHGFARLLEWRVLSAAAKASGEVALSLGLEDTAETRQRWPHAFTLILDVVMDGRGLALTLNAENRGGSAWPWQAAFHPYLRTEDLSDCEVWGLQGLQYYDRLALPPALAEQAAAALPMDRGVDRTYRAAPALCTLRHKDGRELLRVEKANGTATVTWTPGPGMGKPPADLPAEAWKDFVCIEALSHPEPVELAPGAHAYLTTRLSRPA